VNTPTNSTAQEWKNPEKRGYRNLSVPEKILGQREGGPIQKRDLGFTKGSDIRCLASKAPGVSRLASAGSDQESAC